VCGLVGGAGTSTLAYSLAERAARESAAPVLLCEADPAAGALTQLTDLASPHTFGEIGLNLSAGRNLEAPFAEAASGLRVIATEPRRGALPGAAALPLLRQARAAHGLTVVDCGSITRLEALPALELATHILWVLTATAAGLARGSVALDALAPRPRGVAEALVAVATVSPRAFYTRELSALAARRADRLVLVPHAPSLLGPDADPAAALAGTLADLATVLRRSVQ
jgi:Flp pilus assembly CpaE family ATPase